MLRSARFLQSAHKSAVTARVFFSSSVSQNVEVHRSSWPDVENVVTSSSVSIPIPERNVPDDALRFHLTARISHGSSILYPHLQFHPADFKVVMKACIDDLGLNAEEIQVFRQMIGPRFNTGRREVKLTTDRFPNRIENKKYLINLIENLVQEAKNLNATRTQYD